jgi:hypothetical protein
MPVPARRYTAKSREGFIYAAQQLGQHGSMAQLSVYAATGAATRISELIFGHPTFLSMR